MESVTTYDQMEKNDEETWSYCDLRRSINLGSCMICQEILLVFFVELVDDKINKSADGCPNWGTLQITGGRPPSVCRMWAQARQLRPNFDEVYSNIKEEYIQTL